MRPVNVDVNVEFKETLHEQGAPYSIEGYSYSLSHS